MLVLVFGDGLLPYEAAAIGRVSEVAAIGTAFTYQGRLSDNGVTANGPYDFEFQLYDALSGGVQIGSTLSRGDVQVTNGLFTVTLDFGASAFNGGTRYLSIGVRPGASTGAYTTLTPRQAILPSPYAVYSGNSDQLDGVHSTGFLSTSGGVVNGDVSVNGNVTAIYGGGIVHGGAAPPSSRTCSGSSQQQAAMPFRRQPYTLDSGPQQNRASETTQAFHATISAPDAVWVRVRFKDAALGERSYLTITSLKDGSQQRLDAVSLKQWRNTSAYFNGDAVEVALHVAPGDSGVFFRVEELFIGEPYRMAAEAGQIAAPDSICGSTDERVRSNHPAAGRTIRIAGTPPISTAWCTGWIASNGAYLTAGHCAGPGELEMFEFNIPSSLADGTPVFAAADDQYSVVDSSVVFHDNGMGDDWTVFDVYPNSNTGLLPVHAQDAFIRLALAADDPPANVRVTGFGVDGPGPCFGGSGCTQNADNQTQQTHAGSYLTEFYGTSPKVWIEYLVDTQPANSGSPVTHTVNNTAIGVHTNGGCDPTPPASGNAATSFANSDLATAVRTFPGWPMIYVDNGHPATTVSGSIFRPWSLVDIAVFFASDGDTISIVKGSYNEAVTITKAITLTAPVGVVTIGQ